MRVFETVPTTRARRVIEGNGVGTVFATDFVFLDEDTLIVTLVDSSGDEIVQTLNTQYTVDGGEGATGSVIMATAPASDETLVIEREEAYLQETDLLGGDPFAASTIETTFDKIVMMIQQLFDLSKRAIIGPLTRDPDADPLELPEPEDGRFLVGRSDLTGWDNTDLSDTIAGIDLDAISLPISVANGGTGQSKAANMLRANYLATTGSSGAYAATSSPAATGLVDGMLVRIEANHTAEEAMTFNLDGLGDKNILDAHGQSLPNGGFQENGVYTLSYDLGTDAWLAVGHTRPYVSKLSAVRALSSSTSWSKPDNLDYIEVEVVGGGGGSGGCAATDAAAGAGGGGEYGYMRVPAASLSSSETVTIGAAGAAGSSGDSDGGDGGTTSFGSHVTAGGGKGGTGSASSTDAANPGGAGGTGGGPIGGGGGLGGFDTTGAAGGNYGGGGGAPSAHGSSSAQAGAAGAKGVCIVKEYTFEYV